MAKTTKVAEEALKRHALQMLHISECLAIRGKKYSADWLNATTPEYWLGLAQGENNCLEAVLFQQNCYHGFNYIKFDRDEAIRTAPDDVGYADWCRVYFSK